MKTQFWTTDWFGMLIVVVLFGLFGASITEPLERSAYDLGVRNSAQDPSADIAIIAIDDQSIDNLGRWPWPRSILASLIDRLVEAKASVIAPLVFFSEPQLDPGLLKLRELSRDFGQLGFSGSNAETFKQKLVEAEDSLDTDSRLAAAMGRATNVVLPMQFDKGDPLGNPSQPLPDPVAANALSNIEDRIGAAGVGALPTSTISVQPPIPEFTTVAAGLGALLYNVEPDGGVRTDPLVVSYYDRYFPSQSLLIAARSLNLKPADIKVQLGEGVQLGRLNIPTDSALQMLTFFYAKKDGKSRFTTDSFYDVYADKVPVSKYANKVVIIGPTAFGVGQATKTPTDEAMQPVEVMAHQVSSILSEHFFVIPAWAFGLEWLVWLGVVLFLTLALPRLTAGPAALITLAILAGLFVTHLMAMTTQGSWLRLMSPLVLLFAGYLFLTVKKYFLTERSKLRTDDRLTDVNRQLALQYQQEGKLDMAFEKLRSCPVDEALLETLYNLALDFETKRHWAKANSVYEFITKTDANFKDIKARKSANEQKTQFFGSGSGGGGGGGMTALGPGSMLGRYQVERELGKGAMGVVYLGRDPKINRVVAIKTMALSSEFEADELAEVKARFFREAETAGRLTHPNIVTIFDAGEEHDLAYIAMEFLHGHDLARYTKEETLLPVPVVMGIIYKAAVALSYAHSQNVVHRDIKPANIMYEPEAKKVKLTDFGIARITDSSKTKTGMVLGTPSYMSPEQLSGKKVDGRSDLFSLGVMLYQMTTGRLPFKGESMATLMYKIANEPHESIFVVRPELQQMRPCLAAIIDRALNKDADKRYQTGDEMARDLQECAKTRA
jgi:eukaryotic-like serine/threonine-protein kinase